MFAWLPQWYHLFCFLENPGDQIMMTVFLVIIGAILILTLIVSGRQHPGTAQEYYRSRWIKWIVLLIGAYIAYRYLK